MRVIKSIAKFLRESKVNKKGIAKAVDRYFESDKEWVLSRYPSKGGKVFKKFYTKLRIKNRSEELETNLARTKAGRKQITGFEGLLKGILRGRKLNNTK